MPVQKIKSGRVLNPGVNDFIGDRGIIFYDEAVGDLRLSDGSTPGGIPLALGGSGTYVLVTATSVRLGGIKIGSGLIASGDGTVSAVATSTYVLTTASTATLGGVKIGANVSIDSSGTISVAAPFSGSYNDLTDKPSIPDPYVLNTATSSTLGGIKIGSGLIASGDGTVSAVATSTYVLPIASNTVLGGIKVGLNLTIGPDGTLNANTATAGIVQAFKTFKVQGNDDIVADSYDDTIELIAGNGVNIVTSSTASPYKTITIDAASYLGNIDGGWPDAEYGGIIEIDGGNPFDIFGSGQVINGGGI